MFPLSLLYTYFSLYIFQYLSIFTSISFSKNEKNIKFRRCFPVTPPGGRAEVGRVQVTPPPISTNRAYTRDMKSIQGKTFTVALILLYLNLSLSLNLSMPLYLFISLFLNPSLYLNIALSLNLSLSLKSLFVSKISLCL